MPDAKDTPSVGAKHPTVVGAVAGGAVAAAFSSPSTYPNTSIAEVSILEFPVDLLGYYAGAADFEGIVRKKTPATDELTIYLYNLSNLPTPLQTYTESGVGVDGAITLTGRRWSVSVTLDWGFDYALRAVVTNATGDVIADNQAFFATY